MTRYIEVKAAFIENITKYMHLGGAESKEDADYDPDFDAGYTQLEIDRAEKIIDTYLASLLAISSELKSQEREDAILLAVKTAVIAFNKLNDDCRQEIVETLQRDMLCEIILTAAHEAGLESQLDVTQEWREW